MMKILTNTLLCVALLAVTPAMTLAGPHQVDLLTLMNLIDQVPTQSQLLAAGSGQNGEALLQIAQNADLKRYPRARAASLIALFDTPEARQNLALLLDDSKIVDTEIKIQALSGLVYLEKAQAFERLSLMTRDPNPELRAAALRNLGRIEHAGVQAVLHSRMTEGAESVPWIRALARRTVERRLR